MELRKNELSGNEDTRLLKLIAVGMMLMDHLGATVFPSQQIFRVLGRMALPLFAWGVVVGSCKTRSMEKYILRVLLLGICCQPLYMVALNHGWLKLNILFTLTLGLIGIYGIQKKWCLSQFWLPAACLILAQFIKADYGWKGLLFIYILYGVRNTKQGLIAAYIAYGLFWGTSSTQVSALFGYSFPWTQITWLNELISPFFKLQSMIWLSLPLIACKTSSSIAMPRWLSYALYPAHLLVLMAIRLITGTGTIAGMLSYLSIL